MLIATSEIVSSDRIYSLTIEEAEISFDRIAYEGTFLEYFTYICIIFNNYKVIFDPRRSSKSIFNFFHKFKLSAYLI